MHALHVLCEKVFAVEVMILQLVGVGLLPKRRRDGGRGRAVFVLLWTGGAVCGGDGGCAGTEVTSPRLEVKMLDVDVPLPFVLAADSGVAAVPLEGADEGASVRGQDVLLERGIGREQ